MNVSPQASNNAHFLCLGLAAMQRNVTYMVSNQPIISIGQGFVHYLDAISQAHTSC